MGAESPVSPLARTLRLHRESGQLHRFSRICLLAEFSDSARTSIGPGSRISLDPDTRTLEFRTTKNKILLTYTSPLIDRL